MFVKNARFGSRKRAAKLDHRSARKERARHCGAVIVDAHVNRWRTSPELRRDSIVRREIDERSKHAPMGVAPLGIGDELGAPRHSNDDSCRVQAYELHPEPFMK